jgi:beta-glucosidase/6-phospho-beta-glucosidase/beta-galactosidase
MSPITENFDSKERKTADERTGLMRRRQEEKAPFPTAPKNESSISPRHSIKYICVIISLVLIFSLSIVVPKTKFVLHYAFEKRMSIKETPSHYHEFPEDFVWGAATSSYQIEGATNEGGRGMSIWDTYCKGQGNIIDGSNGDLACDHYHRVEEDVRLMKDLGLKAYRFSIAWPRILPNGKTGVGKHGYYNGVNHEGIAFYNRLIDELLKNNIEPWVTLYHWDLPQALEDEYGGWLSPKIIDDFGRYASVCFEAFGDRVTHWITLNESWTVAVQAYEDGTKAPGKIVDPEVEVYLVAHHLLLAHARAVRNYREFFSHIQDGKIGIANCGDFRYPLNPESLHDRDAAERSMVFQYAWLTDPLIFGDYPAEMRIRLGDRLPRFTDSQRLEMIGSLDFMGLNHYSTLYASAKTENSIYRGYWADMDVNFSADPSWHKNVMVSAFSSSISHYMCVFVFLSYTYDIFNSKFSTRVTLIINCYSKGWSTNPDGCRELLRWISKRYVGIPIVITENGTSEDDYNLEVSNTLKGTFELAEKQ